uniref:DUF7789 domain-containing protein n=1 Tax=Poecilia reticulata TaxID=8081 RepID=A0A3P9P1B4_POERE
MVTSDHFSVPVLTSSSHFHVTSALTPRGSVRQSLRPTESPDLLSPNLRPRHQSLIPTPCGPIKSWSELSALVKTYFCFTVVSLLALLGLTVYSIYKQHKNTDVSDEDNFTVSLIQLVGILFCIYYISRGVLQENRQELVAFVLSVLVVMIRSVVNFSVLPFVFQARFVCIMCLGFIHVFCTTFLIQRPNMMAFRVGGALESMQEQYFLLNLCFSMVTFDLQAQVKTRGSFLSQVIEKWFHDQTYTLEAATVTGALISLLIKGVLLWGLIRLVQSFGQGLRERSELKPT